MNENIDKIKDQLRQAVNQEFLPQLFSKINSHKEFLSELSDQIGNYKDLFSNLSIENEFDSIEKVIELKQTILGKLDSRFHLTQGDSVLNDLSSFNIILNNFISETEETRKQIQERDRFYFQKGDSLHLRFLKYFKRIIYRISIIPVQIKNVFLKLFKKPVREIHYWNHVIPLRNLRSIYLKSTHYNNLSELYSKTLSNQTASLLALKSYCEQSEEYFREKHAQLNEPSSEIKDFEATKNKYAQAIEPLDNLKEEFVKRSAEIIENALTNYYTAYIKAGTIELPTQKLSPSKITKYENEYVKLYSKIHKGWNNTLFALADDWRMDYELYKTRYELILKFIKTSSIVSEKLNNNVKPSIALIEKSISGVREKFSNLIQNESEIEKCLTESRNYLQSTLTEKLIPQAIDILLNQEILDNIDQLEDTVEKSLFAMSDKRALVKTDTYDHEIKESEIAYISLRDMLSFSSLPKFKSSLLKTKADQNLKLQKIQNYLLEIDQICDFSIDSALNMLQEKKGTAVEVINVAVEGLDRAIKKNDDIDNQIVNLNDSFYQKTKEPIDKLSEDLIKLTFTDSVFELKIKIAKDRALQKSREFRKKVIHKVKNSIPYLIALSKEGIKRTSQLYFKTRKLIGLEKSKSTIKGEVADFLSETGEAINKLPFVYQRLFVVEPIEDRRFFFGRENELTKLNKAYSNWMVGKFSPTIIYGEKGSGATSLTNVFTKNNSSNHELMKIIIKESAISKEDFINLFYPESDKSKTNELQDLIQFLNNKTSGKKIIVLENLQHLFLRKISGFENLKLLFELISATNQNVFWITTCTIYGYNYLQKTISISDYFVNHIELGDLSDQQIIDIILKRHRVSGYDLNFIADESITANKKYQKLSDEEKQGFLEKNYFSLLNKFADSNISLALLFWVRSTSAISDDKITIGNLPKIDFSFLSSLSNTKLFVLNYLLIHDGLTVEDVSSINGVPIERNKRLLITMIDDGILIKNNNLFQINPLLYRPIVEVLKSKNIIH